MSSKNGHFGKMADDANSENWPTCQMRAVYADLFRRVWALLFLLPVVGGWVWFILVVPDFHWYDRARYDGHCIVLGNFRFDLSNDKTSRFFDDQTAASLQARKNGFSFRTVKKLTRETKGPQTSEQQTTWRNTVYNHLESRMVQDFDLLLDKGERPRFVSERFLLVESPEKLRWLDLEKGTVDWSVVRQVVPNSATTTPFVESHPDQPVFRRTYQTATSTSPSLPSQCSTDLFRFSKDGELLVLASWSHLGSQFESATFKENQILTVDLTGCYLESRSTADGSLVEKIQLKPPAKLLRFSFMKDYLQEESVPPVNYSFSGHRLTNPLNNGLANSSYLKLSPDAKTCLWYDSDITQAIVTDVETNRMVCEIQEPRRSYVYPDSKILISIHDEWGLTFRTHDLTTGETLKRWRPFWWIWPWLAVLLIVTLAWTWFWTRMPKPHEAWGWIDLYTLMSLWTLGLVVRLVIFGDARDATCIPFHCMQRICASGLFIAWCYLFAGSGRWMVRVMHVLATYSIVLTSLAVVHSGRPLEACRGLISVSLPSLVASPIWILVAVYSWRFRKENIHVGKAPLIRHRLHMRDLFLIMCLAAVIILGFKPLLPGMGALSELPRLLSRSGWYLAMILASMWSGGITGALSGGFWKNVGNAICALAILILAANLVMICFRGEHWQLRPAINRFQPLLQTVHASCCAFVTAFLLAKCLAQKEEVSMPFWKNG